MSVTTTSGYGSMSDAWAHRALLQRSKPRCVHNLFGRAFSLPQKNTDTMAFRRQENLNSDPVVLSQDADPAPEQVQKFDINVTIQEFGKSFFSVVKYCSLLKMIQPQKPLITFLSACILC
jgi:N4-gp56 family major capsid protein